MKITQLRSFVFLLAFGAKLWLKGKLYCLVPVSNTNVKQLADLYEVLAKTFFKDRYFENDQRVTSAKLCLLPQSNLTHVPLERALSLNASFKLKEGCKLLSKNLQFFGFAFAG